MADPLEASGQPGDLPDWLESNFRAAENPTEAQARAYPEARQMGHRAMSERDQALAERDQALQYAQSVEERLSELEEMAAQPQDTSPELPFNPLLSQLQQARDMGDLQGEMALTAYMASQLADQKIAERMSAFEQQNQPQGQDPAHTEMYAMWADSAARERFDQQYGQGLWDATRQEAAEYLRANPYLIPENLTPLQAADRLVQAAEYVQGRKLLAGSEQDRNQYAAARQRRIMSQTLTSAGATPPTQETAEEAWARIQSAPAGSYAELRSQQ